jgi:hypothetical protein
MSSEQRAELCWAAARRIATGRPRGMCDALLKVPQPLTGGSRLQVLLDLQEHLGERFDLERFARSLPHPLREPAAAIAARVDLLSLAAEYYEAEAEGRVHP